jgi:hypothetical protein
MISHYKDIKEVTLKNRLFADTKTGGVISRKSSFFHTALTIAVPIPELNTSAFLKR